MKSLLSLLLAFILFVGCDGSYENAPEASEPAFTVTMAPAFAASAATLVPVNSQLILHASAALDPATVNESTVYIQNSFKELQAAYITLIGQDIIVQPKLYLTANMDFEIVITTKLANTAGTHLTETVLIPFSSDLSSPDTTPPTLIDRIAKDKGTIEPQTILYYQFDELISPLNISDSMVTINNSTSGHTILGTVQVSGTLLIFTPNEPFISGSGTYTITLNLNGTVSDLAGNILVQANQVDSLSISSTLTTIQKPLQPNYYSSNSQVHCIESGPSSSSSSNLLYVGGTNGLEIIEFNLLTHSFAKRAQIDPNIVGAIYSIEINTASQRLYLGSSKGFSIYDISEISNPIQLGTYQTTSPVYGAQIFGNHAYLAASLQGVVDLNISNESAPKFLYESNYFSGVAFDIAIIGEEILVADYDKEITLYYGLEADVAGTWSHPTISGHVRQLLHHPTNTFAVLIASGIGGFKIFERDVIGNTYYLNHVATPSYVNKIVLKSTDIYLNVANIGIAQLKLSDYSHQGYLVPQPFIDTATFTQVNDTSGLNKHLILVDNNGRLYSMVL